MADASDSIRAEALGEEARLSALERYDVLDTPGEEAFDRVARIAQKIFGTPIATITLLDAHRQWFKSRIGLSVCETPRDQAFCDVALRRLSALVVPDAAADPDFASNPLVTGEPHIRFYAGAPLVTPDGQMIGTLCVMDQRPREFDAAQAALLADLAHLVIDGLELRRLANVDCLTGVLSRRAFRDEASRAIHLALRHRHDLSLLVLDLDHFKTINDSHGHALGDTVLARSAAAVTGQLRRSDAIGRIGGEEFAVLLPRTGPEAAFELAERLRQAVRLERHKQVAVTASIGVTSLTQEGGDVDLLLKQADRALYEAKSGGRDRTIAWRGESERIGPKRRRVLKGGKILFNERASTLDCTVRSLSDAGAGLDVSNPIAVPERFELSIEADRMMRPCTVVSRSERHVEVEFA